MIKRRFVFFASLAAGLTLAASIYFAPTILSTQWGQAQLNDWINNRIPGKISYKNLQLTWSSGQMIEGFELFDQNGEKIMAFKSLKTDTPLLQFFREGPSLGKTELAALNAKIVQEKPGRTNIHSAIGFEKEHESTSHKSEKSRKTALPFTGEIALQEGNIELNPLDRQAISLKDVNALFQIPTLDGPVHVKLSGFTKQGDVSGNFDLEAAFHNFDTDGFASIGDNALTLLSPKAPGSLLLKANIHNLPVDALDQLLSLSYPQFSGILHEGLGATLDLTLDEIASPEGTSLSLKAASPLFQAHFDGVVTDEQIAITSKGEMQWNITPAFFNLLTQNSPAVPWYLSEPVSGKFVVTQLELPLHHFNIQNIALQAKFMLGEATLPGKGLSDKLSLQHLVATVQSVKEAPSFDLTLQGSALQGAHPFTVDLNASLLKKEPKVSLHGEKEVRLAVTGLPTTIVDRIWPINSALYLGRTITAQSSLHSDGRVTEIIAKVESDRLQIPRLNLLLDRELTLKEAAQATVTLDRGLLPAHWPIDENVTLQALLQKFQAPIFDRDGRFIGFDPLKTVVHGEFINAAPLLIKGLPQLGTIEILKLNGALKGSCLADAECSLFTLVDSSEKYPDLHQILGSQLTANAVVKARVLSNGDCEFGECKLDVKSNHLLAKLKGRIQDNDKLTLLSPFTIQYALTPPSLHTLGWKYHNVSLSDAAHISFVLSPPEQPLSYLNWSKRAYSGELRCDHLALAVGEFSPLVYLQEVNVPWALDLPNQTLGLNFSGKNHVAFQNASGTFAGSAKIAGWQEDWRKAAANLNVYVTRFPSEVLELLTGSEDLGHFIGAFFDMDVKAATPAFGESTGNLELAIHGKQLEGSGSFELQKNYVLQSVKEPINLKFTMTPDRFAAFRRLLDRAANYPHDIALLDPSQVNLEITQLRMPLPISDEPYTHAALEGSFYLDRLHLQDQTDDQNIAFEQTKFMIQAPDLAKQIQFSLTTQTIEQGDSNEIKIAGNLIDAIQPDGKPNWEEMSANLETQFINLPTRLMGKLMLLDSSTFQKVEVLFGDRLSADIKTEMQALNGVIAANLKGKNGRIFLDGKLTDGILTLDKPFEAEFSVTQDLGKVVLADVVPFLRGIQSSDKPMKLTILPEGFNLALLNPLSQETQIASAKVEMGKLEFVKNGHLGTILNLLNNDSQERFSVWLTPLYFDVKDGIVGIQRIDMLVADQYPIAAWGTVDLPKEKVDMMIGLTPRALYHSFHITKLDDSYLLQIPLKGGIRHASIDKNKAMARISALIVQSQGTTEGVMLGTLLHVAGGTLLDTAPPAPTTDPLPWDTAIVEAAPEVTQDEEASSKNPLRRLEKGATSLFKKLFGK